METLYLAHHGIKGQKWGVRRYQNEDGTLTEAGKKKLKKFSDKVDEQKRYAVKANELADNFSEAGDERMANMSVQLRDKYISNVDRLLKKGRIFTEHYFKQPASMLDVHYMNIGKSSTEIYNNYINFVDNQRSSKESLRTHQLITNPGHFSYRLSEIGNR